MADLAPMVQENPVEAHKAQIDQMVQQMLSKAIAPSQMGLGRPASRFSPQQMAPGNFIMDAAQNKQQDIGFALANAGTLIQNLSAQHKQKQVQDALSDWQGFDNALQKATMAAGDPNAPDFSKKVQENLSQMPFVKAMLDPANPKSVKRLKNMHKALNPNIFDDKENVYGEALKTHLKGKDAEKQMLQQKQQLEQLKQQTIQNRIKSLMEQVKMVPPDPKLIESAARILETQAGREESLEFRKQMHLDSLDIQKQNLDLRRDALQDRMNDSKARLEQSADYHKQMISLEHDRVRLEQERASLMADTPALVDAVRRGFPIGKLDAKDRSKVAAAMAKNGERVPFDFSSAEQISLDDSLNQVYKIRAWQTQLQSMKGSDGQLSNQPLGQFWDRIKYWAGKDTPQSAIISDFSRERWAAIGGLVHGVRRGDILRDMVTHTPDPWKDSVRIMNTKLEALSANYSLARATALLEHGYAYDPVSGNDLKDDIKSYGDHLNLAKQDLMNMKAAEQIK